MGRHGVVRTVRVVVGGGGGGRGEHVVVGAVERRVVAQQQRGGGPLRQREEVARAQRHGLQRARALEVLVQHQLRRLRTLLSYNRVGRRYEASDLNGRRLFFLRRWGTRYEIWFNGTVTTYHVNVQKMSLWHESVAEKLQKE